MFKRRAKIMGRGLLRLICFSIGVLYLVFLCLVNFDKSRSNIGLNIKGVSYGTLADAKNNPNVLYIELKEGYKCTYTKNSDGKYVLSLDYGYSTKKDYDGIKLHLFIDKIEHKLSESDKAIYDNSSDADKQKIDNALETNIRINFVSKIIRDFGQNVSHHSSRVTINNKYYSFVSEKGKDSPTQIDPIYNSALDKDDYAYESIDPKKGYACTIILGSITDLMGEESTILGNSTITFDGYLETSLDYEKMGVNNSIFKINPKALLEIIIREIKLMEVWVIVLILVAFSSVWALPSMFKLTFEAAKDGFETLRREGLGRIVSVTETTYSSGRKEYSYSYEHEGLGVASVLVILFSPIIASVLAILKSVLTIFTDIYYFFVE